ncbi:hypothetical protein T484DRAFT_1826034 [Baffinella frigidus]|nr:hypothetical protein T484DRAFT_1826034 [Cryptophyta sp. CCMP2293]
MYQVNLNLSEFMLLGRTSALSMNVAAVFKVLVVSAASAVLFKNKLSELNVVGYVIYMCVLSELNVVGYVICMCGVAGHHPPPPAFVSLTS